MGKKYYMTWDLGATKCAAGLVEYDTTLDTYERLDQTRMRLRECNSLEELTDYFESQLRTRIADIDGLCIGGAGQFDGENLHLQKGYPYPMNFGAMARARGWKNWVVTHDYVPIVCATFTSYMNNPNNVRILHQGEFQPHGRRVAFGVGTGLGLKDGILLPDGHFWLGTNEIGHIGMTCPPLVDISDIQRHREFMKFLRSEAVLGTQTPLTFEEVLSGRGTQYLHQFVTGQTGLTPEEIGDQMRRGWASETLALFAWYLGLFVSTVQLIFMPSGGVWITGGVVLKHMEAFDQADFYRGLNSSPAYRAQRDHFPLGVLKNSEHAYFGGAFFARAHEKLYANT